MVRIHLLRVFFVVQVWSAPKTRMNKKQLQCGERRCSMRGSNPRPLAHKTNTLPTELMEHVCRWWLPASLTGFESRVRGLVVMIVACQVMDPGSIPGERSPFLLALLALSSPGSVGNRFHPPFCHFLQLQTVLPLLSSVLLQVEPSPACSPCIDHIEPKKKRSAQPESNQ